MKSRIQRALCRLLRNFIVHGWSVSNWQKNLYFKLYLLCHARLNALWVKIIKLTNSYNSSLKFLLLSLLFDVLLSGDRKIYHRINKSVTESVFSFHAHHIRSRTIFFRIKNESKRRWKSQLLLVLFMFVYGRLFTVIKCELVPLAKIV